MVCSFVAFADFCQRSWVTFFFGDTTAMARPGVLEGNDKKRDRGIDMD